MLGIAQCHTLLRIPKQMHRSCTRDNGRRVALEIEVTCAERGVDEKNPKFEGVLCGFGRSGADAGGAARSLR